MRKRKREKERRSKGEEKRKIMMNVVTIETIHMYSLPLCVTNHDHVSFGLNRIFHVCCAVNFLKIHYPWEFILN